MRELGQDPLSQGKRRMDWRRCSGFKIFFKEERVELLWSHPNINVNRIMFYIRTIRIRNFGTQVLPIHVISVSKIHVFINHERWSLIVVVSKDERSQRLVELGMFWPMGLVTQGLLKSTAGRHDKITKVKEKKVDQRKSLKHIMPLCRCPILCTFWTWKRRQNDTLEYAVPLALRIIKTLSQDQRCLVQLGKQVGFNIFLEGDSFSGLFGVSRRYWVELGFLFSNCHKLSCGTMIDFT